MTEQQSDVTRIVQADDRLGLCAFRLSMRQWCLVALIAVLFATCISSIWKRLERFESGADYRVPYALSNDYWLYQWHQEKALASPAPVFVVGDSVIWGEFVRPDGTLSHFLNQEVGGGPTFVNAGVNGLFPLALEGLIRYHSDSLRGGRVLLHCNLLWMSSPEVDMSVDKERTFNHVDLVPQFQPRLPCYRGDLNKRLGIVVHRKLPVFGWVKHLQQCYFGQQSIPDWTLQDDGQYPPSYPYASRNPLSQIVLRVPAEPINDPERGPTSARHRAWFDRGLVEQRFDWVTPNKSLQWGAYQRLVVNLLSRDNDVLIVVGPFNEHMIDESSIAGFRQWQQVVRDWCHEHAVLCVEPAALESSRYGDASHPLTDGYDDLARELASDETFLKWLE
jgi:hypothetical protein